MATAILPLLDLAITLYFLPDGIGPGSQDVASADIIIFYHLSLSDDLWVPVTEIVLLLCFNTQPVSLLYERGGQEDMAVMTIPMYKTLLNSVFTMDTIALGYQSIHCQTSQPYYPLRFMREGNKQWHNGSQFCWRTDLVLCLIVGMPSAVPVSFSSTFLCVCVCVCVCVCAYLISFNLQLIHSIHS